MDTEARAPGRYSLVAIALHWVIALLIGLNFAAAWAAEEAHGADKMQIMANHKAIGITVLVLTVLRVAWRLFHRPPPLLESLKPWEAAAAKVVHRLFYVSMLALPLAGWAMHLAGTGGMPVGYFGLFDIPGLPVTKSKELGEIFGDMHETFATLMLALATVHIAASLKHIVVDRDGTMRRMLPW